VDDDRKETTMTATLAPRPVEVPAAAEVPPVRSDDRPQAVDVVDLWGLHSFPASDPPANW
jgi:hypothetical protein